MLAPRIVLALALPLAAFGQNQDYRVYTDAPRLLLRPRRLRLLQRERERKSMRWEQFHALIAGKASMPEPGFALALEYQAAGDREAGLKAIEWALGPATDLRQLALVFDWCQPLLQEPQASTLAAKLRQGLQGSAPPKSVAEARSRALAAIALAGRLPEVSAGALRQVVQQWWTGTIAPALEKGQEVVSRGDLYALFEMLHTVQDNLNLDLREQARGFFKELPLYDLLSYYPASYPAAENEYRIPSARNPQPDLDRAALARAAELSMLAYDPNAEEYQFLQGWAMHDRFLLRGAFGIPYEFLWANPYHPGLSYYNLPLMLHDELFGRLFVRSSWDDDALWAGYFNGQLQMFVKSEPKVVPLAAVSTPLEIGDALIVAGHDRLRFRANSAVKAAFVLGLEPRQRYDVEVDDEEMSEAYADRGGILEVRFSQGLRGGVRIKKAAVSNTSP